MSYNEETGKHVGYIYRIQNKTNCHAYIGQTIRTPQERWDEHIRSSFNGCGTHAINKAIQKYGSDGFDYIIEEEIEEENRIDLVKELNALEISYIEKFNSYEDGYNMTKGGNYTHNTSSVAIDIYSLDGKFIMYCDSLTIAAMEFDLSMSSISQVINGKYGYTEGYVIRRHGEPFDEYEVFKKDKYKKKVYQFDRDGNLINTYSSHKEVYNKYNVIIAKVVDNPHGMAAGYWWGSTEKFNGKDAFSKKIDKYSMNGEYIGTFNTLSEAAHSVGQTNISAISSCCNGNVKSSYGYVWRYSPDNFNKYESKRIVNCNKVDMYSIDGELLNTFSSVHEASEYTGLDYDKIARCCGRKQKTCGGYIFVWEGTKPNLIVGTGDRIIQCDMDYVIENIFNSINIAHDALGNSESCIRDSIKYGRPTKNRRFFRINIKEAPAPEIGSKFVVDDDELSPSGDRTRNTTE